MKNMTYVLNISETISQDFVELDDLKEKTIKKAIKYLSGKNYIVKYSEGNLYGMFYPEDNKYVQNSFCINKLHKI